MPLPVMNVLHCKIGAVDFTLDNVLNEAADVGGTTQLAKNLSGIPPPLESAKVKDTEKVMMRTNGVYGCVFGFGVRAGRMKLRLEGVDDVDGVLLMLVDFKKVVDSVSWKYLDHMLHILCFGVTWRSWIRACLESSRNSILVNGSPTFEFSVKRGLRQRDPLSSFVFIIVVEGLHMALMEASHSGLIRELAKKDDEETESCKGGDEVSESEGETDEEETRQEEEESFDPIPRTPEGSEDGGNDEEDQELRLSEEARIQEEEEVDELYRDVNINQGRGLQVTKNVEDTHVTLTPVHPDGPQESSSMSSFVTSMLNPISDAWVESIFTTASFPIVSLQPPTPIMTPFTIATITTSGDAPIPSTTIPSIILENLPTFNSAFRFDERLRSLETTFSEYRQTNPFVDAVSAILGLHMALMEASHSGLIRVVKAFHGQEGGFGLIDIASHGIWAKIVGSLNYLHSNEILPSDYIRYHVGCGNSIRFWKDLWTGNSLLYLRYNRIFRLKQDKYCLISNRFKDDQWT
nr:cysteine-rich receptor-like protein kinase [Tanacetum cinerariifolium]